MGMGKGATEKRRWREEIPTDPRLEVVVFGPSHASGRRDARQRASAPQAPNTHHLAPTTHRPPTTTALKRPSTSSGLRRRDKSPPQPYSHHSGSPSRPLWPPIRAGLTESCSAQPTPSVGGQGCCSPAKRWCPLPIGGRRWAETLWSVGTPYLNALRYRFQTLPSRSLTSGSDRPV